MLETEAPHTAQFERQARGDDAKTFADQPRISALQIERRVDADRRQPAGDGNPAAADKAIIGTRSAERASTSMKAATSPPLFTAAICRARSASGTGSRTARVGGPGRRPAPARAPPCFLFTIIVRLP